MWHAIKFVVTTLALLCGFLSGRAYEAHKHSAKLSQLIAESELRSAEYEALTAEAKIRFAAQDRLNKLMEKAIGEIERAVTVTP